LSTKPHKIMKTYISIIICLLPLVTWAQNEKKTTDNSKVKGYYNYTSIGTLVGSKGDENTYISSLIMEHNYQFNKRIAIGIVTGIEWFDVSVLPLGPNLKLFAPQRNNASFFLGLSGGYAMALEDMEFPDFEVTDTKGGYFMNSEIGYLFPSLRNYKLFVAIGYRYHEFELTRQDWLLNQVDRKTKYNRFSLRVGVSIF